MKKKPASPQKAVPAGLRAGGPPPPPPPGRPAPARRQPPPYGTGSLSAPGPGNARTLPGASGPPARKPAPAKKPAAKKKPAKPKPRKLALGSVVACCSAEALAASLRLTGRRVTDADVLALYERTADGPDEGASILATLEAARRFGLARVRPGEVHEFDVRDINVRADQCGELKSLHLGELDLLDDSAVTLLDRHQPFSLAKLNGDGGDIGRGDPMLVLVHPLILGLQLPAGPHAVLADHGRWWSWGEPYDPAAFPDAVVEEAWAVTW